MDREVPGGINRFALCTMNAGGSIVPLASYRPLILVGNHVLIPSFGFSHVVDSSLRKKLHSEYTPALIATVIGLVLNSSSGSRPVQIPSAADDLWSARSFRVSRTPKPRENSSQAARDQEASAHSRWARTNHGHRVSKLPGAVRHRHLPNFGFHRDNKNRPACGRRKARPAVRSLLYDSKRAAARNATAPLRFPWPQKPDRVLSADPDQNRGQPR